MCPEWTLDEMAVGEGSANLSLAPANVFSNRANFRTAAPQIVGKGAAISLWISNHQKAHASFPALVTNRMANIGLVISRVTGT